MQLTPEPVRTETLLSDGARALSLERRAIRKAALRLIWFLILLYLLNNIDRTNVGFAALTMNHALGLSAQMFGISVGIFYCGYLLFEIPSNLIFVRIGARRSLARMAIASGCVTVLTALVRGPLSFYALRFLLGIAEAGYLPGIVLYLSYWFPSAYRARFNALFMLSLPLAFTLSSALAGTILGMDGTLGLAGWQWLFILEGSPAVVAGIVALFYLSDSPKDASWMPLAERQWLQATLAAEAAASTIQHHKKFAGILLDPVVLTSAMIYCALNFGLVTLTAWTPTVIKTFDLPYREVGFVSMIAPLVGAVAMILWGRESDRKGERVVNTGLALLVGAVGWALAALAHAPGWIVCGFVLAAVGIYSTYAISWAIPQTYIARENRALAIAVVGVLGNLGGIFVPMIVGTLRTATHNFTAAFLVIATVMALGALVTFRLKFTLSRQLHRNRS
jgi:ACS family tartrate transporter-like MFS transporter